MQVMCWFVRTGDTETEHLQFTFDTRREIRMMFCFCCALLRQRSFSQLPWYSKPGVTAKGQKANRMEGWRWKEWHVFFFFSS